MKEDVILDKEMVIKPLYNLYLVDAGENKLQLLKLIKEVLNIGLKEAKNFIDSTPVLLMENISYEYMKGSRKLFEDLGATIRCFQSEEDATSKPLFPISEELTYTINDFKFKL